MTMAALVQSYPQQSGTITMLQTRNGSGSGVMPPQSQGSQQYGNTQQQRNSFHGMPGASGGAPTYRGSAVPIQPYAFTATPSLNPAGQRQPYPTFRANSSSAVPTIQSFDHNNAYPRSRHAINSSLPNLPSGGSRDDSALPPPGARRSSGTPRPQSAYFASSTASAPFNSVPPAKNQPDRYRRPALRTTESGPAGSAAPSGSGMASVGHLYTPPANNRERRPSPSNGNRPMSFHAKLPGSVDDMQLYRASDDSRRFRRRSMPALDTAIIPKSLASTDNRKSNGSPVDQSTKPTDKDQIKTARLVTINSPTTSHIRNGSSESLVSSRSSNSRPSSVRIPICTHPRGHWPITANMQPGSRNLTYADECFVQSTNRNNVASPTGNPAQLSTSSDNVSQDSPKLVTIPPRSSSSDAAKRIGNPSPLSKPVTMESEVQKGGSPTAAAGSESKTAPAAPTAAVTAPAAPAASASSYESPAVKQLAAINQKGGKLKSKTSRLRRALSFSSVAEFKKAGTAEDAKNNGSTGAATGVDDLDPEQARIAEQQEAAGIGQNIYAGSRLFSGSTDNLSISSTASSASIMIRKMGRGMKKGGRSLAGLFRPKSIIGVPTAETPEASQATVSMVTVEAERERVNVNVEPTQNGGGTDFPRLERNSLDASQVADGLAPERAGSSGTDNSNSRKSIVGGDRERAEVLAAVRKGILKREFPTDVHQICAVHLTCTRFPRECADTVSTTHREGTSL